MDSDHLTNLFAILKSLMPTVVRNDRTWKNYMILLHGLWEQLLLS